MKRTVACGLVLAAVLGGAISAQAGDFHFSFGIGLGLGHGGYYSRPYGFGRPYFAFRPYSYAYFGYNRYHTAYSFRYSPFYFSPHYYAPYYSGRARYYVPARVYRPYRVDRNEDLRVYRSDRGYVEYTPRRYQRPR